MDKYNKALAHKVFRAFLILFFSKAYAVAFKAVMVLFLSQAATPFDTAYAIYIT